MFHTTYLSYQGPPPMGAAAAAPQAATPPAIIHRYLQHLQRTGVQACTVHPGGTSRRLQHHFTDGEQGCQTRLLSQHVEVQRGVLTVDHDKCW